MRYLILGATGYIGGSVARRLVEDGHEVVGLARSGRAELDVRARGCTPLRAQLTDTRELAGAASRADGVVVALGREADGVAQALPELTRAVVGALSGSRKPLLFTSGASVYADTGDVPAREDAALAPGRMVAWAVELERAVLAAADRDVRAVVVRPGIAYGRAGGRIVLDLIALAQAARTARTPRFRGASDVRLSTVHVDDLAHLYARALEGAPAGTILNAAADPPVLTLDLADAAAWAAAAGGTAPSLDPAEAQERLAFLAFLFAKSAWISSDRANRLLGWQPHRPSLLAELRRGSYAPLTAAA